MATLINSIVGCICVGRTCASANGEKTVRLGACCSGDGALKTSVGYCASNSASGAEITAFGTNALKSNTGGCNTGIGVNTLLCGSGNCNTAAGHNAIKNITTGNNNLGVGYYALKNLTTGGCNVGIGAYAGRCLTTGIKNTFAGYDSRTCSAGIERATIIGTNSIACASCATVLGTDSCACADGIAIGNGVCAGTSTTRWGSTFNNTCNCVWAAWATFSDSRDKTDIVDLTDNLGINFIRKLKPVFYKNDARQSYVKLCGYEYGTKDGNLKVNKRNYGFIAQDVKDTADELNIQFDAIKYNEDSDEFGLTYSEFIASIVKTIKTIDERIQVLKTKIQ